MDICGNAICNCNTEQNISIEFLRKDCVLELGKGIKWGDNTSFVFPHQGIKVVLKDNVEIPSGYQIFFTENTVINASYEFTISNDSNMVMLPCGTKRYSNDNM